MKDQFNIHIMFGSLSSAYWNTVLCFWTLHDGLFKNINAYAYAVTNGEHKIPIFFPNIHNICISDSEGDNFY